MGYSDANLRIISQNKLVLTAQSEIEVLQLINVNSLAT